MAEPMVGRVIGSPLGNLVLVASADAPLGVFFEDHGRRPVIPGLGTIAAARALPAPGVHPVLDAMEAVLASYFAGEKVDSWSVPAGIGTDFQRAVWQAIAHIPPGQTATYGQLAAAIGRPHAVRAVGAAVGANPLSILNPCHRVMGAGGAITGYAGGVARKTWLLNHELT